MKLFIFSSVSLFSFVLPSFADDGFASIFNGKEEPKIKKDGTWVTFTGKGMSVKTEGNWQVQKDGSLFLDPRPGEKGWTRYGSYLWLTEDYEDFVFEFEYKHGKGGNSGLYFRIYDESDATKHGFEVQILDCYGKKKLGPHDLGGVIQTAGPLTNASKPAGDVPLQANHRTSLSRRQLQYLHCTHSDVGKTLRASSSCTHGIAEECHSH